MNAGKDDGGGSLTEKIFEQGHSLDDREEGLRVVPGKPAPTAEDAPSAPPSDSEGPALTSPEPDGGKVPKIATPTPPGAPGGRPGKPGKPKP
jgi:hypothetical protein